MLRLAYCFLFHKNKKEELAEACLLKKGRTSWLGKPATYCCKHPSILRQERFFFNFFFVYLSPAPPGADGPNGPPVKYILRGPMGPPMGGTGKVSTNAEISPTLPPLGGGGRAPYGTSRLAPRTGPPLKIYFTGGPMGAPYGVGG